jgi:hypothetical protein
MNDDGDVALSLGTSPPLESADEEKTEEEDQGNEEEEEEEEEDRMEEENSTVVGWVTSTSGRRVLATRAQPPVLVLGVGDGNAVEIGYDVELVRPPKLTVSREKKQKNGHVRPPGGAPPRVNVIPRPPPRPLPRPPSRLTSRPPPRPPPEPLVALRQRTLAQPTANLATLRAMGSHRRSAETHLRGGNMLYADPQIVRPWYMLPEARRSCGALFSSYVKAQCFLWEVCLFYVSAAVHIVVVLVWQLSRSGGGDGGSAGSVLSRYDIDRAIVSQGAVSLPMTPYTGSYSGAALALTLVGILALGSQLSEIITCYVIAAGIHLAITLTSTGTTINLFLPLLQALMVYCAVRNRSRHNYSMIVADPTF